MAGARHDLSEVTLQASSTNPMSRGMEERLPYAREGFTEQAACKRTPELLRRIGGGSN